MSQLLRIFRRKPTNGSVPVRTGRLILRPLAEADLAEVTRLAGDWDVASMTARIPYPYTLADARHWLEGLEDGEVVCAIERAEDGALVGVTGYLPAEPGSDQSSAEIGYWIGKPYWGNGYATEAARALIAQCFNGAGFGTLTCCHFSDNPASRRVIEKLGFEPAGPCMRWCEARRIEAPAEHYVLKRPGGFRFGSRKA